MTLPTRCSNSMNSILTVAADGRASPVRVVEVACWGEGTLGQCADAHDRVVPASLALISRTRSVLSHVVA